MNHALKKKGVLVGLLVLVFLALVPQVMNADRPPLAATIL
jgi:hypothetical protein